MTKKDLFRIIIKLAGLYLVVIVFTSLPNALYGLFLQYQFEFSLINLVTLAVLVGVLYVLLIKTDLILNLFKLDKGFDDDKVSTENLSPASIFNVGLVIISIYFIVASLPGVITQLINVFRDSIPKNTLENPFDDVYRIKTNYSFLFASCIQLALGFLLITNRRGIARKTEAINKD